jgi:hypothetical protein
MRLHFKAALLSAFVLPGLGQVIKQEKVKGIILIVLTNIFILVAMVVVIQGMKQVVAGMQVTGAGALPQARGMLQLQSPAGRWLLSSFVALWVYSVADALFAAGKSGDA